MKVLIICLIVLTFTIAGCQKGNNDINGTKKEIVNESETQVVSSGKMLNKNIIEEITGFGGETFDPELQIKVNDDGFFDHNTKLSIIEEDDNTFVIWAPRGGLFFNSGIIGSIAKNGKWEVTNKVLFENSEYLSWDIEGTYLLTLQNTGDWSNLQKQISIRQLTSDGTLTKEVVIATAPIVKNLDIIPTSHGTVVIFSNNGGDTKEITYDVIPIEDKSLAINSITIKQFPEGGIDKPIYIDFTNKKLFGPGKKSKGLLQVSSENGEPLYDDTGKEKVARIGEPVYIGSNKKGELEVFSNNNDYLLKHVFDKNLNMKSEEIIGPKNKLITINDDILHYWEVTLYKNRPSLNLTKIKN
ncbi:hypothetical protein V7147_21920 [Bacillus sp. JJ1521]|uniref:hypothetical protein n=1 Tax=Bacillus sp. JJ1521 TaxID=3122957 RepID=UPI002FFF7A0A